MGHHGPFSFAGTKGLWILGNPLVGFRWGGDGLGAWEGGKLEILEGWRDRSNEGCTHSSSESSFPGTPSLQSNIPDVRAGELVIPEYLLHDVACKARDVDLIHIDT